MAVNLFSPMSQTNAEFKGIRAMLWPIHNYELKKFIPMALIMLFILFNYTVARNTKDTLILASAGAGTITFIKMYLVTPFAVLFVVLYAKASNVLNHEKVFYATMIPFLVFFGIFGFFLSPNADMIHPSVESIVALKASHPRLEGFINIYANWSYSLFFIMAELWGSMLLSLSFWQFANRITKMTEAKRFYGLFVVVANVATILSGYVVASAASWVSGYVADQVSQWQMVVKLLMSMFLVSGVICMFIYRWMHKTVLTDKRFYDESEVKVKKDKKKKPGLVESVKIIFTSPELGLILTLILSYGITINLVEVQWKNQVAMHFMGDKLAMNAFMGTYSGWTGVATIVFALFFGSNILRRFGWFVGAIFTPVVIISLGSLLFSFILGKNLMSHLFENVTYVAAITGAAVIIFSKAVKYCLFDPTKEMAYIPLDEELKTKGKAAVDVVGGRLGKSGGALVQTVLFMIMATTEVVAIAPIACVAFVGMCIAWMYAVKALDKRITDNAKAKK